MTCRYSHWRSKKTFGFHVAIRNSGVMKTICNDHEYYAQINFCTTLRCVDARDEKLSKERKKNEQFFEFYMFKGHIVMLRDLSILFFYLRFVLRLFWFFKALPLPYQIVLPPSTRGVDSKPQPEPLPLPEVPALLTSGRNLWSMRMITGIQVSYKIKSPVSDSEKSERILKVGKGDLWYVLRWLACLGLQIFVQVSMLR